MCNDDGCLVLFCLFLYSLFLLHLVTAVHKMSYMANMCGVDEMSLSGEVIANDKHSSLYASQAAESYLRFPTTASPCSDWLPCQAEVVQAKTVSLGRCANAYSCGSR